MICIDDKSQQLVGHSRAARPLESSTPAKQDHECVGKGTTNPFVAVEPKAGHRVVSVAERRGKTDFVAIVQALPNHTYSKGRHIHLALRPET